MDLFGNITNLFNGINDYEDLIIIKHLLLSLSGFILGTIFNFFTMSYIGKKITIAKDLNKLYAVRLEIEGDGQYIIRKPRNISDFIFTLIAYIKLRYTGQAISIPSKKLKLIFNSIIILYVIIVLCSGLFLIDNIILPTKSMN